MKHIIFSSLLALILALGLSACDEASIEPELSGDIEGKVVDFETRATLTGVTITTNPPTVAVETDGSGTFTLEGLNPGNYTVAASRTGYDANSVTVSVRENRTTPVTLSLKKTVETPKKVAAVEVGILTWSSRLAGDSAFVDVQYNVKNVGEVDIPNYEVYFRIQTPTSKFMEEVKGKDLKIGQADVARFERYLLKDKATDVAIDGYWIEQPAVAK